MRQFLDSYLRTSLIVKVSIALVLGVLVGLVFGEGAASLLAPFGEILLRLLKLLIIPIVLLTLIVGINQGDLAGTGRIGRKIAGWYVVSSAVAIVVGLAVATLFSPGGGMTLAGAGTIEVPENPGAIDVLTNVVPDNIFTAFTELNLLGILFIAIVFGTALLIMRGAGDEARRELAEHVLRTVEGLSEATMIVMRGVLQYLPIGIFAIVAGTVAEQGGATLVSLAGVVLVLYAALAVHATLYLGALVLFGVRLRPFLAAVRTPALTAFATQSSTGTLPVTQEAARGLGLSRQVYGFTLPLGATVNMDGAAIRIAVSAVFAANVVGAPLGIAEIAQIVLVGTLATIGTAGVPGAGIIMIATVFAQVGLPIETVALLVSIDALVGMGCTALNVTGDLVGTAIVDRGESGAPRPDGAPERVAAQPSQSRA